MSAAPVRQEGMIDVTGGRVWFARLGEGDKLPVLMLHGGPGGASHYMEPLAERLAGDRPVIVYDQLGCGRSDRPRDTSLWTVDRFVEEVDQVRDALGLERCHLIGQSWGGWLGIEYMCRGPAGVEKLVLASTSASTRQFVEEARKLIEAMPEPHRTTLIELGARGEFTAPRYQEAVEVFYHLHLCRLDPWPEAMLASMRQMEGNQVYATMNGPTEFDVIGTLRDWDRTPDLGSISAPTLVTCGRYDEIPQPCAETIAAGIPDARVVVFEHSSHVAHLEEPDRYEAVVREFLG